MYAKQGIRCNAICPGATMTNIGESIPKDRSDSMGAKRATEFAALIPAALEPKDIAALAMFLASDEARFINGAIIPADGGWDAA
jgi:NAD(P)-dependent dehydrogenase (short-subunit alcohol dehydrogenase family)